MAVKAVTTYRKLLAFGKVYGVAEEEDLPDLYEGLAVNYLSLGEEAASAYYYNLLIGVDDTLTKENKLRRFFVENYPILENLIALKQADFSACMDDTSIAPTCERWTKLLAQMKKEQAPFTLKELAITGQDILQNLDVEARHISTLLQQLLLHAVCTPKDNEKQRLIHLANCFSKNIK